MDLDKYLKPISADLPCGDDLEDLDDMDFSALENLVPVNHEIGMFDADEQEVNWPEVKKKSLLLLERSKDIRIVLYLLQAQLNLTGIKGFTQAIELLEALITRYWDSIYPELDHDDNDDPIERINALKILGDSYSFFNVLKKTPIAEAKGFGSICFRDCELANGNISPAEGEKKLELAHIHAIFMDADKEFLEETIEQIVKAVELLKRLDAYLLEIIPADAPTELKELIKVLLAIHKTINVQVQERDDWSTEAEIIAKMDQLNTKTENNNTQVSQASVAIIKKGINSREDVIRSIEEICKYYKEKEPSSPVPLLLQRAKRLVDKDFMEIIKDMAEDALSEISNIAGKTDEDDK